MTARKSSKSAQKSVQQTVSTTSQKSTKTAAKPAAKVVLDQTQERVFNVILNLVEEGSWAGSMSEFMTQARRYSRAKLFTESTPRNLRLVVNTLVDSLAKAGVDVTFRKSHGKRLVEFVA